MESKKLWVVVAILITILAVIGAFYYRTTQETEEFDNLDTALEDEISNIEVVPSIDVLGDIVADTNLVKDINPFTDEYQNPFE